MYSERENLHRLLLERSVSFTEPLDTELSIILCLLNSVPREDQGKVRELIFHIGLLPKVICTIKLLLHIKMFKRAFQHIFFTDCFVYVALTVHASREYHPRTI